jgi:hypothetical protein
MDPEDAQDGGADEQQEDQGFLVCIWCKPDGSFAVGTEDAAEEMNEGAEGGGEGDELAGYTPAKTAKEALTLALGLIKSGGKDNGQEAMGKQIQSAGFEAGYNED